MLPESVDRFGLLDARVCEMGIDPIGRRVAFLGRPIALWAQVSISRTLFVNNASRGIEMGEPAKSKLFKTYIPLRSPILLLRNVMNTLSMTSYVENLIDRPIDRFVIQTIDLPLETLPLRLFVSWIQYIRGVLSLEQA